MGGKLGDAALAVADGLAVAGPHALELGDDFGAASQVEHFHVVPRRVARAALPARPYHVGRRAALHVGLADRHAVPLVDPEVAVGPAGGDRILHVHQMLDRVRVHGPARAGRDIRVCAPARAAPPDPFPRAVAAAPGGGRGRGARLRASAPAARPPALVRPPCRLAPGAHCRAEKVIFWRQRLPKRERVACGEGRRRRTSASGRPPSGQAGRDAASTRWSMSRPWKGSTRE